MVIDEFISTYAEMEVQKMKAREDRGLSPVPRIDDTSPSNKFQASPKSSSRLNKSAVRDKSAPKSPNNIGRTVKSPTSGINGTFRTKQFTQEKLEKLKASGATRVVGSEK